ncbi:MAG: hypothetical protein HOV80_28515 [Polyangiaceae bacterium]|nr:hypothetical protein [Polyangiaceae bacterium]
MSVLAIVCAVIVTLVGHCVLVAALARRAGIEVSRVSIFYGPRILETTIGGVTVELGLLPLGSYVAFPQVDPEAADGKTVLDAAPRSTRLMLAVTPYAVTLALGLLVLGPVDGLRAFGRAFIQLPAGGFLFFKYGRELVGSVVEALATLSPLVIGALTLVKLSAFNLLPLPTLSGARAVEALIGRSLPVGAFAAGALLVPLCALGWIAAIVSYWLA